MIRKLRVLVYFCSWILETFRVGKDQRQQVVINTNRERYKNAVSLNAVTSQISSLNNCMHIIIVSLYIHFNEI